MDHHEGAVIEAPYPFIRSEYISFGEDGAIEVPSWKPGTRTVPVYPDDAEDVADAMGAIVLTVVSIHKPGRYPARVFFVRQWKDPAGRLFGNNQLRITTMPAFRRLAAGFRHEFRMATAADD